MRQFILEQALVTQDAFLSCLDAKCLITSMSHFLSLTFQPKDILFCIESDDFQCLAQHPSGKPIHHFELSPSKLDYDISNEQLWELAGQKESLSAYLPITSLSIKTQSNESQQWYCLKLQMKSKQGICIFLHSPVQTAMELWQTEPLLGALVLQFFHLLQQFRLNQHSKVQLVKRDKQEALYLQEINLQQAFSSKIIKLHSLSQQLLATDSIDELYKISVESLRNLLGFDRTCLILVDALQHSMHSTYGTDELGNTIDETSFVYDMEILQPEMQHTLLHTDKLLTVVENTPLYTAGKVVGIGWNAMVVLRDGDNLIGWVAIDNLLKKQPILDYEKELLTFYSSMLSSAIVKKREESSLRLLHDSAIQLSHLTTELDVCRSAVEFTKERLNIDRVAVFLSYDNGQSMKGTFGTDINGQLIDEASFDGPLPKNSLLELALNSPHQLAFEASVPLYHEDKIVGHGWNAAMLLRNQDQIIGFLVLDNLINKRPLTSHSKNLITLFASNLSEIISRQRAEESVYKLNNELESLVEKRTEQLAKVNMALESSNHKLAQLSLIDPLTNIANRRQFDKTYQREWSTACRQQKNLSIIMLDVDFFKPYNDFYGHQQGDKCLIQLANLLQKHFRRSGELVARYGGEEFVTLLTDTSEEKVIERIQGVLDDLYSQKIRHKESPLKRVTFSAGIATAQITKELSAAHLLKCADEALYQAKSAGRNKLVVSEYSKSYNDCALI